MECFLAICPTGFNQWHSEVRLQGRNKNSLLHIEQEQEFITGLDLKPSILIVFLTVFSGRICSTGNIWSVVSVRVRVRVWVCKYDRIIFVKIQTNRRSSSPRPRKQSCVRNSGGCWIKLSLLFLWDKFKALETIARTQGYADWEWKIELKKATRIKWLKNPLETEIEIDEWVKKSESTSNTAEIWRENWKIYQDLLQDSRDIQSFYWFRQESLFVLMVSLSIIYFDYFLRFDLLCFKILSLHQCFIDFQFPLYFLLNL